MRHIALTIQIVQLQLHAPTLIPRRGRSNGPRRGGADGDGPRRGGADGDGPRRGGAEGDKVSAGIPEVRLLRLLRMLRIDYLAPNVRWCSTSAAAAWGFRYFSIVSNYSI